MALQNRTTSVRSAAGARRLGDRLLSGLWAVIHPFHGHHWAEITEVNLGRGWSRYRGVRCTVCDEPWEGW